ncbi:MAG: tetratricopeptide repeat protein, partial [Myxococcota bacterium]
MLGTTALLITALLATPEEAYAILEDVPLLIKAGELDEAYAKSLAALEADAENFEALSLAAALAEKTGKPEKALELQRSILALDSNADEARLAIARLELALGNREAAQQMNESLLERHPQSEDGLKLRRAIRMGTTAPEPEPVESSAVKPLVRLDMVTGYDSNPTLLNDTDGAVGTASVEDAAILTMDGSVGFYVDGKERPFTLLARVRNTSTFDGSDAVTSSLPSTVGLSAIARRRVGEKSLLIGDLRYQSLFVDNFNDRIQHFVAPSGLLTYDLGVHQLRALAGLELRFLDGDLNVSDSVTPRLAVRDTIRLGKALLIADEKSQFEPRERAKLVNSKV